MQKTELETRKKVGQREARREAGSEASCRDPRAKPHRWRSRQGAQGWLWETGATHAPATWGFQPGPRATAVSMAPQPPNTIATLCPPVRL